MRYGNENKQQSKPDQKNPLFFRSLAGSLIKFGFKILLT